MDRRGFIGSTLAAGLGLVLGPVCAVPRIWRRWTLNEPGVFTSCDLIVPAGENEYICGRWGRVDVFGTLSVEDGAHIQEIVLHEGSAVFWDHPWHSLDTTKIRCADPAFRIVEFTG